MNTSKPATDGKGSKIRIPEEARITLAAEWTCPTCKGEKDIPHPTWVKFWTTCREKYHATTGKECEKLVDDFMKAEGYGTSHPREEIQCDDCDGLGFKVEPIDFEEALRRSPMIHTIAAAAAIAIAMETKDET